MALRSTVLTGRLAVAAEADDEEPQQSTYGASRLGLVPSAAPPTSEAPAESAVATPPSAPRPDPEPPTATVATEPPEPARPAERPEPTPPEPPAAPTPTPVRECKKGTFKLPTKLLDRLRSQATATHRYQYVIVASALEWFFERGPQLPAEGCRGLLPWLTRSLPPRGADKGPQECAEKPDDTSPRCVGPEDPR